MTRTLLFPIALGASSICGAQDTLRVQVHGAVVNALTEVPVYEALVEWYDATGNRQAITQSNSAGNYALFIHTTGFVELRVEENGYRPYSEQFTIVPGESARELLIALVPQ